MKSSPRFPPLCPAVAQAVLVLLAGIGSEPCARASVASVHAPGSVEVKAPQDPAGDEAELVREARAECDLLRRRGETRKAERQISELLSEHPDDADALVIRAALHARAGRTTAALKDLERARTLTAQWTSDPGGTRALALRRTSSILRGLGRASEARVLLEANASLLAPAVDGRDALELGSALFASGARDQARAVFELGSSTGGDNGWEALLCRGLCQQRLGRLEAASASILAADDAAIALEGSEPDVLAARADLFFEADREVESAAARSPAKLYEAALALDPTHEGALLGMFVLHRANWQRQTRSAHEFLTSALEAHPESVETLIVAAAADLEDGQLRSARERLVTLAKLAPGRREVRTLDATLRYVDRDVEGAERVLAQLVAEDPADSRPERELGRQLSELYRFAEALPFARRAVERDASDWEAQKELGRALANTGDEVGARAALDRAAKAAAGRQDAWRDNLRLVLKRIAERHGRVQSDDLSFSWEGAGDEVLRTYLIPFYTEARTELARRYGFTPGPTTIEVFKSHRDFSVRSTGFEGFPALGVCFGPVVTAVSPLAEMRGSQSWARTSFHEFTHVVHLGISHNRCPRWVTEGLATWEEVNKRPAWTRNMRRELVDSIANGDVIPVRELNRAFRGPRILFGYYQGGLLCQMLIERSGFAPLVRLLEAFDRGLDLDAAFGEVFKTTPEALDRDFALFVARETRGLAIEPRWKPAHAARVRAGLARTPPLDPVKAQAWVEGWCTVAWQAWQSQRKVDAQEALRQVKDSVPAPARALFLRGEIALSEQNADRAVELWSQGLALGGDDYRVRMALGTIAKDQGLVELAEQHFLAAEKVFPGYDDPELSAELALAKLYREQKREDDAFRALDRRLAFDAGELKDRLAVARWHLAAGRNEPAIERFAEANEIDPFLRALHMDWADALTRAGRHAEALREYGSALAVPYDLDAEDKEPWSDARRAAVIVRQAAALVALDKKDEARVKVKAALALDATSSEALELEKALP